MKKVILIAIPILLIASIASVIAYEKYFVISVYPGTEAIIISSGKIIGKPLTSGFHTINAFTQKAHHIDMERVRTWSHKLHKHAPHQINIYWVVDNSLSFYTKLQAQDDSKQLESIFATATDTFESATDTNVIENISEMQKGNCDYQDATLSNLTSLLHGKTKEYGVKVFRISFPCTN
jgi:hypothetical protein